MPKITQQVRGKPGSLYSVLVFNPSSQILLPTEKPHTAYESINYLSFPHLSINHVRQQSNAACECF